MKQILIEFIAFAWSNILMFHWRFTSASECRFIFIHDCFLWLHKHLTTLNTFQLLFSFILNLIPSNIFFFFFIRFVWLNWIRERILAHRYSEKWEENHIEQIKTKLKLRRTCLLNKIWFVPRLKMVFFLFCVYASMKLNWLKTIDWVWAEKSCS